MINGETTNTNTGMSGIDVPVVNNDAGACGGEDLSTVTITETAENCTVTVNPDGSINYIPNAGFVGTDEVTYQVCNDCGMCDTATLGIDVMGECETFTTEICTQPLTPVTLSLIHI